MVTFRNDTSIAVSLPRLSQTFRDPSSVVCMATKLKFWRKHGRKDQG